MTPELKLYQRKTRLLIGGIVMAICMVGLLIQLSIGPNPDSVFRPFRSPLIVYSFGIAGVLLTGYFAWFAFNSLRNPTPRVILSDNGIVVNGFSGKFSANWDEFSGYKLVNGSIYVLLLRDADKFLAGQPSGRAQQTARTLSEKFGSPFLIETSMLDVRNETVQNVLKEHLQFVQ